MTESCAVPIAGEAAKSTRNRFLDRFPIQALSSFFPGGVMGVWSNVQVHFFAGEVSSMRKPLFIAEVPMSSHY